MFFDLNNYVTFYRNIKKKRAPLAQLKSWLPTRSTTPAPRSSPTTRSTATASGMWDTSSPMPSSENVCARTVRLLRRFAYVCLRRHYKGQAEDDTSAARALREDLSASLKALCGGEQVCAQFGTPLVRTAKSCDSLSINRIDSSRRDYFFDNVQVTMTLPPPHSLCLLTF